MWTNGASIQILYDFKNELRDSFMHETPSPIYGGNGYMNSLDGGTSDSLIENNIFWFGNKTNVMRGAGGGNVFAYNYGDDAFGYTYADTPEAGINTGHLVGPQMELVEGNYSQNYKGDSYWGNTFYITVFRNWFSAHRAAAHELATYTNTTSCGGGLVQTYGDYAGVAAIDLQAYSYYHSIIGNILGRSGQSLLTEPAPACVGPQTGFVEQITTTAQYNGSGANPFVMWQIGVDKVYNDGTTFVDSTINTQIRTANWDWMTQTEKCFDKSPWTTTGNTTDQGCSGVTLPASFYLSAKPSFFGAYPWPWVDPTTGTTYTLPAKYCFEHGQMPTCIHS
jgi:hypothetical protein